MNLIKKLLIKLAGVEADLAELTIHRQAGEQGTIWYREYTKVKADTGFGERETLRNERDHLKWLNSELTHSIESQTERIHKLIKRIDELLAEKAEQSIKNS